MMKRFSLTQRTDMCGQPYQLYAWFEGTAEKPASQIAVVVDQDSSVAELRKIFGEFCTAIEREEGFQSPGLYALLPVPLPDK